jgi:transposase, IS5 family
LAVSSELNNASKPDSRILEKSRQHLIKLASGNKIALRQNYNREAPRLAAQVGRCAHAKQYRRMKKSLRTLKTREEPRNFLMRGSCF